MIKFSIIVVCLNAGQDLIGTVDNLMNQNYNNYEIIIKDGISTDGSIELLPPDQKIRTFVTKDSGIYDAMNQGIRFCTGDYIIFINAGDGLYDSCVLKKLALFIENDNSSLYYGHSYNLRFKAVDVVPSKLTKYFCFRSMICHQATVYKSSILKQRGFDTSYKVSADRERMLYAVINEKVVSKYIPVVISLFKSGGISSTISGKSAVQNENITMKKRYFSRDERFLFACLHIITFPGLRKIISTNPKLSKIYRKLIHNIYKTNIGGRYEKKD